MLKGFLAAAGIVQVLVAVSTALQKDWMPAIFYELSAILIWQMYAHEDRRK